MNPWQGNQDNVRQTQKCCFWSNFVESAKCFLRLGPRFPSMTSIYDKTLQTKASDISKECGYGDFTRNGVYCMLSGPTYETQAELRLVQAVS